MCKDFQRRRIFNQFFCLGAVVTIKASEDGPPVKIYHENGFKVYQGDINAGDSEWIKASLFLKHLYF